MNLHPGPGLVALGALAALTLPGCRQEVEQPVCPAGLREDPPRAARITSRLGGAREGLDVLRRARRPFRICFGPAAESTVGPHGILTLAEEESEAEAAARLGHLLLHLVEGDPFSDGLRGSRPCPSLVRDAVMGEARAHALELRLRRELQVRAPRRTFPFERDFWNAPAVARVELVAAYFHAHPRGGEGLPGFVVAFTQRCAAAGGRR